jgi:predicted SnoaL-like aldol condensation-catalyzing enzyme
MKPGGKPSGILPCKAIRWRHDALETMSISELNKRKVRRFFEEVLNDGRLELIDELVARDFVGRLGRVASAVSGPAGVRRFVSDQRIAHPDLYIQIEDQIAEGDRVVTRWRATGRALSSPVPAASAGLSPGCGGITIIRLLAGIQVDAYTEYAGPDGSGW